MSEVQYEQIRRGITVFLTPILLGIIAFFLIQYANRLDRLVESTYETLMEVRMLEQAIESHEERLDLHERILLDKKFIVVKEAKK